MFSFLKAVLEMMKLSSMSCKFSTYCMYFKYIHINIIFGYITSSRLSAICHNGMLNYLALTSILITALQQQMPRSPNAKHTMTSLTIIAFNQLQCLQVHCHFLSCLAKKLVDMSGDITELQWFHQAPAPIPSYGQRKRSPYWPVCKFHTILAIFSVLTSVAAHHLPFFSE